MDPDATLAAITRALDDDDLELARELFGDLSEWLAKGGFEPEGLAAVTSRLARAVIDDHERRGPHWRYADSETKVS